MIYEIFPLNGKYVLFFIINNFSDIMLNSHKKQAYNVFRDHRKPPINALE